MSGYETEIDLGLFATWGSAGTLKTGFDFAAAERVLLEVKSADGADSGEDLRKVLNALTDELKAQFKTFQRLRLAAEKVLESAGDDEAAVKLAKADIKASSDAIGQIVRTLEKVDNLQRSMADARTAAAHDAISDADIDAMRDEFLGLIEERAKEMACSIIAANGRADAGGLDQLPEPGG